LDYLDNFKIEYSGLKDGLHQFDYQIGNEFFSKFEGSLIEDGDLKVDLEFDKQENFFHLSFQLSGTVKAECDRCLELFDLPLNESFNMIIKQSQDLGTSESEEDGEIIFISSNDSSLNVAKYIYEFSILSLPLKKVHEDGACNKEVLKYLENQEHAPQTEDPRWEGLAKIKTN
jgi:uncharacterized metal-binding protein YceD (DUF177 family)